MSYEPYQPPGAPAPSSTPEPGAGGAWHVIVEYANNGQAKPPTIIQVGQRRFATFEEALGSAAQAAREFEPPDPWSLQSREVYRDGSQAFLVILRGATSTFHMSVRVVQAA